MLALLRLLGYRHLARRGVRTALVVASIALGMAMVVSVQETARGATRALTRAVEEAGGRAQLEIVANGETGLDEHLLEAVRAVPGVAQALATIRVRARLAGRPGRTFLITGIDLLDDAARDFYDMRFADGSDDPLMFVAQMDSLALGAEFAARSGFELGAAVPILTREGRRDFVVRALLDGGGRGLGLAVGGDVGVMDLAAAQHAFGRDGRVERIDVALVSGTDVTATASALAPVVGAAGSVGLPATRGPAVDQMLASFGLMNVFLSVIALGAACFLIYGVTAIAVAERRREIAILRGLGATRRQAVALFAGEALLVGAVASAAGLLLGISIASAIPHALGALVEETFQVRLGLAPPSFAPADLARHFLVGLAATVAAALLAARRAARVPVVDALGVLSPAAAARRARRRRLAVAGLLAGLSAAAVLAQQRMALFLVGGSADLLLVLAVFLAAPAVIAVLGPRLVRPARAVLGISGELALRNLARQAERLAAPVVVLAIGLHLAVTVGAVAESFERSILGWLGQASARDLVVTASGTLAERTAAPLDARVADELAAIPGVAEVRPIRETRVRFRDAEIGLRAWALAEPPTRRDLERFTFLEGRAAEAIPALAGGGVALVSQNLAYRFGLHASDVIDLPAPAGAVRVRIVGVVLDYLAQSGTVIVARPEYVRRWHDPLADGFGIGLAPGADARETRAQITDRLGERFDLVVLTLGDYLAETRTLIRRAFLPLRAIEVVTLVIGLLSLVNALLVSVAERFRELGLLRASGASMRQLVVMVLVEAEATTVIAVLLGVASGVYGSEAWIRVHIPVATGWIVPYAFPFATLATSLGAAFALAAGAGAWPARIAARTPVVDALRAES